MKLDSALIKLRGIYLQSLGTPHEMLNDNARLSSLVLVKLVCT